MSGGWQIEDVGPSTEPRRDTATSGSLWSTLSDLLPSYDDFAAKATNGVADFFYYMGYPGLTHERAIAAEQAQGGRPPFWGEGGPPPLRPEYLDTAARLVVPQSPTQAMIDLGAAATGLWGAKKFASPLARSVTRIGGAAGGGFIGGGAENEPVGGAIRGGLAGIGGEILSYPASAVGRALFQSGIDDRAVGRAIGEISPEIGPMRNAAEIQDVLIGRGAKDRLSPAYQQVRDETAAVMRGQPGYQSARPVEAPDPLHGGGATYGVAPDLAPEGMPPLSGRINYGGGQAGFPGSLSSNTISAPKGGALEMLSGGKSAMTFEEAAQLIEDIGTGRHPLTGKLTGSQAGAAERALHRQAVEEMTTNLRYVDPALAATWREAELTYARGNELVRLFREAGVIDNAGGGINMIALQDLVATKQDLLETMIGRPGYETLRRVAYRGSVPPGRDYERPVFSEHVYGNPRGMAPGMSSSWSLRLPRHYTGNALRAPAFPFVMPADNLNALGGQFVPIDPALNPYR